MGQIRRDEYGQTSPYLPHIWVRNGECRSTQTFGLTTRGPVERQFTFRTVTGQAPRRLREDIGSPVVDALTVLRVPHSTST